MKNETVFNEEKLKHQLAHYLPAQVDMNDFTHHNTLPVFEEFPVEETLQRRSEIFGYKVYLSINSIRSAQDLLF